MSVDKVDPVRRQKEMAAPAFHLIDAEESLSFSKIGGLPNLPQNIDWPRWNEIPLSFLAQIDLSKLGDPHFSGDLASKEYLYFFYDDRQSTWGFDPADRGSWQVLYLAEEPPTILREAPRDLPRDAVFGEKYVTARAMTSYPDVGRLGVDKASLSDKVLDDLLAQKDAPFNGKPQHQVGGFPNPVQDDEMELECQLVSNGLYCGDLSGYNDPRVATLGAGATEWKLLLQLDSDDDANMMWGDLGLLYFWIRSSDLVTRNFSNVWMILQCS